MGTRQRHGTSTGRRGRAPGRQREAREAEKAAGHGRTEEQIRTRSGCGDTTAAAGKSAREVSRRTGTGLDWNESEQIEGTAQGCSRKRKREGQGNSTDANVCEACQKGERMRPRHATDAEGEMTTCKAAERIGNGISRATRREAGQRWRVFA
ncbi:hypothetical protein ERJ75_000602400 [Trypanosoma vivax]|nr:hypothetical protein ERJ75_000602400 [Trypanosoma vivax]